MAVTFTSQRLLYLMRAGDTRLCWCLPSVATLFLTEAVQGRRLPPSPRLLCGKGPYFCADVWQGHLLHDLAAFLIVTVN